MQKGQISVQTENIFPIIKKFLYSDQDIFLRELVSNAVDATTKVKTLATAGELGGEIGDTTIEIILDETAKTLTIRDKGIGMDEEEVKKYLNQVAFSSAQEFLDKYKDEAGIIGHFGLGFYSAFMVAKQVDVITKSYKANSVGVTWSCEGDIEYSLEDNDKSARGTDIVLHIAEDSEEFLQKHKIEELLRKYCKFLPVPIQFGTTTQTIEKEPAKDDEAAVTEEVEVPNIINNTDPAWKKAPTELSDEDYLAFYRELHPYTPDPMFWIHLNIDYPFNLTGILYFPKVLNQLELQKNKIQLYSNQVFVTDEVKEIVPEFLTLLHGVIDSPDIPLNVSRSYLQSDSNVRKITGYITKKVSDKLFELFKNDRESFESKWPDLSVFVKYGMLSDEKFHDRAQKFALLKNVDGAFFTLEEYQEKVKDQQTDKNNRVIYLYTNSPIDHDVFIKAAKNKGYDILEMDHIIDNHFIQHLEYKLENIQLVRVDADTVDNLIQKEEAAESVLGEAEQEKIKTWFTEITKEKPGAMVELKPLSPEDQPVIVTRPEFMRRMKEMQQLQGMGDPSMFPDSFQVIVNANHPLIATKLLNEEDEGKRKDLAQYLLNLGLLHQQMLRGADLTAFIEKSLERL